jgi:hypothetical protein
MTFDSTLAPSRRAIAHTLRGCAETPLRADDPSRNRVLARLKFYTGFDVNVSYRYNTADLFVIKSLHVLSCLKMWRKPCGNSHLYL